MFQRGQAVLGCGRLHHEQGGMGFVYVFCEWHCALAVVSGLHADLSMQLSASSGVVPVGDAGSGCRWVNDSEWCPGGSKSRALCRVKLALCTCRVDWLWADLGFTRE